MMNIASSPATAVTFGFFILPMKEELGWSASALTIGLSFRLIVAGLTAPMLGSLLDRVGARVIGTVAAITTGLSIAAIGLVDDLWVYYLLSAISGLGGFGGPTGQLLTLVPVSKWFHEKRGRAMAIATIGMPGGNLLMIPLGQYIIDSAGWRDAWLILGGLLILFAVPPCLFFMRKDPESMGLPVDGIEHAAIQPDGNAAPPPALAASWTATQARRTRVFWVAAAATGLMGFVAQGTLVHRVPFWQETGISSGYVAIGTAMAPLLVVLAALYFGWLADRVSMRLIALAGGLITAMSMLPMVVAANSLVLLFMHNILWGVGQGANTTAANLLWPDYFGRGHAGAIRGMIFPVLVGTAAASNPFFAVFLDSAPDPRVVWLLPFLAFAAAGVMFYSTRSPGPPPAPEAPEIVKEAPAAAGSTL
jgi:MFS family permease